MEPIQHTSKELPVYGSGEVQICDSDTRKFDGSRRQAGPSRKITKLRNRRLSTVEEREIPVSGEAGLKPSGRVGVCGVAHRRVRLRSRDETGSESGSSSSDIGELVRCMWDSGVNDCAWNSSGSEEEPGLADLR